MTYNIKIKRYKPNLNKTLIKIKLYITINYTIMWDNHQLIATIEMSVNRSRTLLIEMSVNQ